MSRRGARWSALALRFAFVLAPRGARALDVRGDHPAFAAQVPPGFVALANVRPDVFAFAWEAPNRAPIVLTLRALDGPIADERVGADEARSIVAAAAPGAVVAVETVATMGLDVTLVIAETRGADVVAVAALPSLPRAMQLTVTGSVTDAALVRTAARDVVASFRAQTNWRPARERARIRIAHRALGAGWVLLACYAVAYALWFRRNPQHRLARVSLAACALPFILASSVLASVSHGRFALGTVMPALVAVLVLANALARGPAR